MWRCSRRGVRARGCRASRSRNEAALGQSDDLGPDPALTVMPYSHSVLLIPNQLALLSAHMSPDQEMIDRYVGKAVAMFLARYGTP